MEGQAGETGDAMDIRALERENKMLRRENRACRVQERLFERLLEMIGSASEEKVLGHAMDQALGITAKLTGARTGSLFLLDESGKVTGSLLTRGEVAPELRSSLVGTVLTKGLAGWVRTHCRAGIIRDTLDDERWIHLPDEPYAVRSALALPIIKRGVLFGILTLMHPDPDFFDDESVETAQMVAGHMAVAIEGAQLYVRIEELNRVRRNALVRDLDLARQVQQSFLPPGMPRIKGYEFSAVNRPALSVGGDFYYFYNLDGNRLGVAIGDVSGKGVAASLFMARLSSELQHYTRELDDPGQLLERVNQELCERSKHGMFVTLVYMVIELSTGTGYVANAGHIPPLRQEGSRVAPPGRWCVQGAASGGNFRCLLRAGRVPPGRG